MPTKKQIARTTHPISPAIRASLQALRSEHSRWNDKALPSDSWWAAVDGVIEAVGSAGQGDRPPLNNAELAFVEPVCNMIEGRFAKVPEGEDSAPGPSMDLLRAINVILETKPKDWPALESVKTLHKQKVRASQIAKMHGLTVGQIEEIANDEAEYPVGHITPHVRDQKRSQLLMRNRITLSYNRFLTLKAIHDIPTVDEMIDDGLSIGDIADEFDVDPEAVAQEAVRRGYEPAEEMTLEEQIYSLADQGARRAEIAETLNVNIQKVGAILRARDTTDEEVDAKQAKAKVGRKKKRILKR